MSDKYNMLDYLAWRGDLSFDNDSINQVDGLIFSVLSYINWDKMPWENLKFKDIVTYTGMLSRKDCDLGPRIIGKSVLELFEKAAECRRYRDVTLVNYKNIFDEERQIQFAAATFKLPNDRIVIAFRGTDESLIGWKEDLNMAFLDNIPSHDEATKYVEENIPEGARFVLCGHSKGGNLAVWAATHAKNVNFSENCIAIFSNDGPGFKNDLIESYEYKKIRNKLYSFVPQASIVGILLNHDDYFTIGSEGVAAFQHDPFLWNVMGNSFVEAEREKIFGQRADETINLWISALSTEEREQLVECLWSIISSSDAKTLSDFGSVKAIFSMQKAVLKLDFDSKKEIINAMWQLLVNSVNLRHERNE